MIVKRLEVCLSLLLESCDFPSFVFVVHPFIWRRILACMQHDPRVEGWRLLRPPCPFLTRIRSMHSTAAAQLDKAATDGAPSHPTPPRATLVGNPPRRQPTSWLYGDP